MTSTLIIRNVTVAGHRTSIRLEPAMWDALSEICRRERHSAHDICTMIDAQREASSLTAALRVYIMSYYRSATTEDGHLRAGHGVGAPRKKGAFPAPPRAEPPPAGAAPEPEGLAP
jgi:predicted DNA-binding ribbon-helix-helix protein